MTQHDMPQTDRNGRSGAGISSGHAPLRPYNVGGRAANHIPARQSRLRNSVSASDVAPAPSNARSQPRPQNADEKERSAVSAHHDSDDEDGYPSDHSMDNGIVRPPRHRRPRRAGNTPAVARHPPNDDEDAGAYYGGRVSATVGRNLGWIL